MRNVLYGSDQSEPTSEACAKLTQEFFKGDTLHLLIVCLPNLDLGVSSLTNLFSVVGQNLHGCFGPHTPRNLNCDNCILWLLIGLEMFMPAFLICFANHIELYYMLQGRQDATLVIANLLKQKVNSQVLASDYLERNIGLVDILVPGYFHLQLPRNSQWSFRFPWILCSSFQT